MFDTTTLDRQGRVWRYRIVYSRLSYEHTQAQAAWMNHMGFEPPANDL
ncbi:hypothetical protein [Azospirillum sp. SYSU D00513]|nr:hypothetical protein [Azospirillum sp. SYSU D00513]